MAKRARPRGRKAETRAVADRLHTAAIRLLRGLRREDGASGLGPARLSALSVLVFGGPRTLGELASIEQVRAPTMTRIVRGLEDDGLAARRRDPDDGRVSHVRATAAGRRVLLAARDRRLDRLQERLAGLSREELDLLGKAAEVLRRLP